MTVIRTSPEVAETIHRTIEAYKQATPQPFIRQFFTVPNTIVGRFVLRMMRRYLNRGSYEMRIHGRGTKWWAKLHDRICRWHNSRKYLRDMALEFKDTHGKYWPTWRTRYGIRLRFAARLGIYLDKKRRP